MPELDRLHVLFVCAMNRWRSATAEKLYRIDPRLEVRSAGLRAEARRRVSPDDIAWADIILVMERAHKVVLRELYSQSDLPPVVVLDIPDDFQYMDDDLQEILRLAVDAELQALLAPKE